MVGLRMQSELVVHELEQLVEIHVQFEQQLNSHIYDLILFKLKCALCVEILNCKIELALIQHKVSLKHAIQALSILAYALALNFGSLLAFVFIFIFQEFAIQAEFTSSRENLLDYILHLLKNLLVFFVRKHFQIFNNFFCALRDFLKSFANVFIW